MLKTQVQLVPSSDEPFLWLTPVLRTLLFKGPHGHRRKWKLHGLEVKTPRTGFSPLPRATSRTNFYHLSTHTLQLPPSHSESRSCQWPPIPRCGLLGPPPQPVGLLPAPGLSPAVLAAALNVPPARVGQRRSWGGGSCPRTPAHISPGFGVLGVPSLTAIAGPLSNAARLQF